MHNTFAIMRITILNFKKFVFGEVKKIPEQNKDSLYK
jgi:hypothetical protein